MKLFTKMTQIISRQPKNQINLKDLEISNQTRHLNIIISWMTNKQTLNCKHKNKQKIKHKIRNKNITKCIPSLNNLLISSACASSHSLSASAFGSSSTNNPSKRSRPTSGTWAESAVCRSAASRRSPTARVCTPSKCPVICYKITSTKTTASGLKTWVTQCQTPTKKAKATSRRM